MITIINRAMSPTNGYLQNSFEEWGEIRILSAFLEIKFAASCDNTI